jgi:hypothetical protein
LLTHRPSMQRGPWSGLAKLGRTCSGRPHRDAPGGHPSQPQCRLQTRDLLPTHLGSERVASAMTASSVLSGLPGGCPPNRVADRGADYYSLRCGHVVKAITNIKMSDQHPIDPGQGGSGPSAKASRAVLGPKVARLVGDLFACLKWFSQKEMGPPLVFDLSLCRRPSDHGRARADGSERIMRQIRD